MPSIARRQRWTTILGVMLLLAATSAALSTRHWGNSAIALIIVLVAAAAVGYLAGRHMTRILPAVLTFVTVLVVSLPIAHLASGGVLPREWFGNALVAFLVVVIPWWVGRYRLLRTQKLISEATIRAEHAQAEERSRIADNLHDTIGHELALIAVQAGALELGDSIRAEQSAQFRALREAAVRASVHLRDVVVATRPEGPSRLDPNGGDGIETLVLGARANGMTIDELIDHAVITGAHPLIAELVVQTVREGLTNAARHAPGAPITLEISSDGTEGLMVSVRSAAPTRSDTHPEMRGAGHGIPSLRRRAEVLGGRVDTAAAPDGGFELRLRTPPLAEAVEPISTDAAVPALGPNARTSRRRLLQAVAIPAAIVAIALIGYAALQATTAAQPRTSSEMYSVIDAGRTPSELSFVLPAGGAGTITVVAEPPNSGAAECECASGQDS